MSAHPHKNGLAFSCDECGADWTPPRSGTVLSFTESLDLAKQDGWRAVPVPSKSGRTDWEHRCPECRQ